VKPDPEVGIVVVRLRLWWLRLCLKHLLQRLNHLANERDHALFCYDMEVVDEVEAKIRRISRRCARFGAAITYINQRRKS
jgi:hypothetical protein